MPKPNLELRSMTRAEIEALEDPTILYDAITEGVWGGVPNYHCPCCPHSYLDREEIVEHLRLFHVAPVMAERMSRPVGVGLFDSRGQMITDREETNAKD
jgi:hypothetical protein